jgi:hypothetical protein
MILLGVPVLMAVLVHAPLAWPLAEATIQAQ